VGEASEAHAERVAKGQGRTCRVGCCSNEEEPGRPPKLASGLSSRGAGPLLGRKDTNACVCTCSSEGKRLSHRPHWGE